jgi:hypothetical protein
VVCGRSRLMLSAAYDSRDAHHAKAARLLALATVTVGCGCGLLKMLLAPLPAALGALPDVWGGNVIRCILVVAWGRESSATMLLVVYWAVALHSSSVVFLTVLTSAWKGSINGTTHMPLLGASYLAPWVMAVSPLPSGLVVVWVPRAPLKLCANLVGPSTSLGFNAWTSLLQRGLGREISLSWWSHSCRGGLHGRPSPTSAGVGCARGRVRAMVADALRSLDGGDGVDLFQLAVHLVHSIDGGRWRGFQGSGHSGLGVALLTASGASHSLGPSLGGGVIHHQDPLHPKRGLMLRQPLARQLTHSIIALPPAQHRVAERGLVLIFCPDERTIAQKEGPR